jgi:exodeoxyribonuclease V alpha subunit
MTSPEILLAQAFARHVAAWARLAGAPAPAVDAAARAARALSLATSEGHVCIDLAELAAMADDVTLRTLPLEPPPPPPPLSPLPADDVEARRAPASRPGTASWRSMLRASGTTGTPDDPGACPLILDDEDRLYLHRDFDFERRLAARLVRARAGTVPADALRRVLRERLASFFAGDAEGRGAGADGQKVAAALALRGRLTIISGGPGTGKTTTVVNLLACLLSIDPACRIALAAPTGKAAARMNEALRERAAHLPAELRARLPEGASTVHRLLHAGADGRFRHDAAHPLAIDVLVVDEASMLDLALATRLLEAVPPDARIVLLGDKDQLSAVEAGAVFSELSRNPSMSAECIGELAALSGVPAEDIPAPATVTPAVAARDGVSPRSGSGRDLPAGQASDVPHLETERPRGSAPPPRAAATPSPGDDRQGDLFEARSPTSSAPASPLADSVIWLTRNFRFASESGIGRLAGLVNAGAADAALAWLSTAGDEAVHWWPEGEARPGPATLAALEAGFEGYATALEADPCDRLRAAEAFGRFRVLCAQREGARGVAGINDEMGRRLRERIAPAAAVDDASPWYLGRPVIVLANDYVLRLFNGDVGLVLPDQRGDLRVHFADASAPGGFRAIASARLPRHDTAFALTVHKAQGSEFDDVLVLLPLRPSRVCTRELLYTAVTRARRRADIVASRAVLAATIAISTRRRSGLLSRLDDARARRSS